MEKNKILSLIDNPLEGELHDEDVEIKYDIVQGEELTKLINGSMSKWLKGESNGSKESR